MKAHRRGNPKVTLNAPPAGRLDIWWESLAGPNAQGGAIGTPIVLERVLARYGDSPPGGPHIVRDDYGKPHLGEADGLSFNLSHSETMAVFAVADGSPVGVDCEAVRPIDDLPSVAALTFSRAELDVLAHAGAAFATPLFYRVWTRKEALVKAIGVGLSYPLTDLTVLAGEGETPALVEAPGYGAWWVASIKAPAGYMAACASERAFRVCYRTESDALRAG